VTRLAQACDNLCDTARTTLRRRHDTGSHTLRLSLARGCYSVLTTLCHPLAQPWDNRCHIAITKPETVL